MSAVTAAAAATATATADESAAELILQHIARATSKAPARADDVRAALALPAAPFADAIALLKRRCQIATAEIQRAGDDAMWQAIWPTGVRVEHGCWTGSSHSGLFARNDTPRRFPAAPDPTRDPRPDLRTQPQRPPAQEPAMPPIDYPARRKSGELQDAVVAALDDVPRSRAIAGSDLAALLGVTPANLRCCASALVRKGLIGETVHPTGARPGHLYYDIDAEDEAAAAAPPEPACAPAAQAAPSWERLAGEAVAETDHPVRIGLWDDGSLTIIDGDDILQYPPAITARIARLLGVPADVQHPLTTHQPGA